MYKTVCIFLTAWYWTSEACSSRITWLWHHRVSRRALLAYFSSSLELLTSTPVILFLHLRAWSITWQHLLENTSALYQCFWLQHCIFVPPANRLNIVIMSVWLVAFPWNFCSVCRAEVKGFKLSVCAHHPIYHRPVLSHHCSMKNSYKTKLFLPGPIQKTFSKSAQIHICLYSCGDWAR